jgi:two-component system, chemotaxis family, CheB/CheR fusion protein
MIDHRPDMAEEESALSDESGHDDALAEAPPVESDPEWPALLEYLLQERGFDFHGYKPASLSRRIRKRMETVGAHSFGAYQEYLKAHPAEFSTLFNTILINVTGFFRDPPAWEAVRSRAVPHILAAKSSPDEPIRAWSAGCASGEEAYTIAMVLAEELGIEEFQQRVKIYATDVDDDALNAARHATYSERHVQGVPPELLSKYFEQAEGIYTFRKDLRRQVIFGRHDLINDAPISRVDLLTCRNTLMYFSAETQARVLSRLHFALNDGGFLLLGRAETLMAHGHSFVTVDLKRRLSRKGPRRSARDRVYVPPAERAAQQDGGPDGHIHLAALEASPVAQLVVDSAGELVVANERARDLFGLRKDDAGRPLRDLQLSYRPIELRSLIERVESERRPLMVKEIEWRGRQADLRWLDLSIAPLVDGAGVVSGTILTFSDATLHRQLRRELEQSHQELETAYEELQSTNEELETTNEELQSTVEELETTNEELQSTNEELETMNEELQSTNEELQTLNDELRQRGEDLNTSNAFLHSVLSSLEGGVAVVDNQFRILAWNRQAMDLWGLREEEVGGKHLLNLDIGLPLEQITPLLRKCMSGESENQTLTLEAVNRRGKSIRCQVTCTPLANGSEGVRGAILMMENSSDDRP